MNLRSHNEPSFSTEAIIEKNTEILSQIVSTLPQSESPEATDGRFGYYSPLEMKSNGAEGVLEIFIRDHDDEIFNYRIEAVRKLVEAIAFIYKGKADITTSVSYHNMAKINSMDPSAVNAIFSAASKLGIDCYEQIIRGGTDGARIAEVMKISCPNIFTGGHNFHSLYEWVSLEAMNKAVNLILGIVENGD